MNSNKSIYLEAAITIGKKVLSNAIIHKGLINWYAHTSHPTQPNSQKTVYANLKYHYYDGLLGLALFFAHLYKESGILDFKDSCIKIIDTIEKQSDDNDERMTHSLYSGMVGKVYVYNQVAILLEQEKVHSLFSIYLNKVLNSKYPSEKFVSDIISGPISLVSFWLDLNLTLKDERITTLLEKVKEHIFTNAISKNLKGGKAWQTIVNNPPLIGYAHGTSGYIHALLEFYKRQEDDKILELIQFAREYEDTYYNSFYKNWPDLRLNDKGEPSGYMQAWCHGAPGVMLSRVFYDYVVDKKLNTNTLEILDQIKEENTAKMNKMASFSLCHGLSGNCEPFLLAAKLFKQENHLQEAYRIADYGIEQYDKHRLNFPSGMLHGKRSPSLMIGDAGVGMFYLRMLNASIPSPIFISNVWKEN